MTADRLPAQTAATAAIAQLTDALQQAYMRMIPHVGTPPWTLGSPEAAARDLIEDLVGADPGLRLEAGQAILAAVAMPADHQASDQIAAAWWATPLGRLVALADQAVDEAATVSITDARTLLGVTRTRIYQLIGAGQLATGTKRGTVLLHSVLRRMQAPNALPDR